MQIIDSRPVCVVVVHYRRATEVGLRDIRNDLQRNGIDPVAGNNVAGEDRLPGAVGVPRIRIVNGGARAAHIAAKLRVIREGQDRRIRGVIEIDFVTAEVEQLVPDNVAARKAAERVFYQVGGLRYPRRVGEEVVRLEGGVDVVLVRS